MDPQEPQSVADLPEWAELVREQDYSRTVLLGNQLLVKLSAPQVESLVTEFCAAPSEKVKWEAAGLLLTLIRNHDPRLRRDLIPSIAAAAKGFVVQDFPRTDFAARSLSVLRLTDEFAAEQFLLSLDPSKYGKEELDRYFSALENPPSAAKWKKVQELEEVGGEIGSRAVRALGNAGKLSDKQVAEIAERYRTDRTAANLNKIFHVRLRFVIGKPVGTIIALLGEPHQRGAVGTEVRYLLYQSDDHRALAAIYFRDETITDVSQRMPEY